MRIPRKAWVNRLEQPGRIQQKRLRLGGAPEV
jgi:hypothetical protein